MLQYGFDVIFSFPENVESSTNSTKISHWNQLRTKNKLYIILF